MKLGIVGSRRRNTKEDKNLIEERIFELTPELIISGGCKKGADRFAELLAKEIDIPMKIFYPKLPLKGAPYFEFAKAYHARNKLIADKSDMLIALVAPDRKGGTESTIKYFLENHLKKELIIL